MTGEMMRAAVMQDWHLRVDDVPIPTPRPHQMLVRVRACGICGSDLHMVEHGAEMRAQQARLAAEAPGRGVADRSPEVANEATTAFAAERPTIMGHEFCCEVLEVGAAVRGYASGDIVVSFPVAFDAPGDRSTMHTIGYSNAYPGGYAEYMVLDAERSLKVPAGTPVDAAALTEPLAVGIHAVAMSRIVPGEAALVLGLGPVGLACVAALKANGVGPIIGSDFSPARRALGAALGCDDVVDPGVEHPLAAWRRAGSRRPLVVFEAVGAPGMIDQAMRMAPRRSRILVVGVCMPTDHFHPVIGINKELSVQFALGYTSAEFARALAWIAEGRVDPSPLITDRVGIDEIPAAFTALRDPERQAKILVVP